LGGGGGLWEKRTRPGAAGRAPAVHGREQAPEADLPALLSVQAQVAAGARAAAAGLSAVRARVRQVPLQRAPPAQPPRGGHAQRRQLPPRQACAWGPAWGHRTVQPLAHGWQGGGRAFAYSRQATGHRAAARLPGKDTGGPRASQRCLVLAERKAAW